MLGPPCTWLDQILNSTHVSNSHRLQLGHASPGCDAWPLGARVTTKLSRSGTTSCYALMLCLFRQYQCQEFCRKRTDTHCGMPLPSNLADATAYLQSRTILAAVGCAATMPSLMLFDCCFTNAFRNSEFHNDRLHWSLAVDIRHVNSQVWLIRVPGCKPEIWLVRHVHDRR